MEVTYWLWTSWFAKDDSRLVYIGFLDRLVPFSLRNQMRDDFDLLESDSMTVAEYKS